MSDPISFRHRSILYITSVGKFFVWRRQLFLLMEIWLKNTSRPHQSIKFVTLSPKIFHLWCLCYCILMILHLIIFKYYFKIKTSNLCKGSCKFCCFYHQTCQKLPIYVWFVWSFIGNFGIVIYFYLISLDFLIHKLGKCIKSIKTDNITGYGK